MRLKKHLINYLLIVCIGLMPSLGLSAAVTDHDNLMWEHCIDSMAMETVGHDSCSSDICFSFAGHCGSGFSFTILSAAVINQGVVAARMTGHDRLDSRFRSHLVFSIYRPPIV
jgi:hypothetical protein